MIGIGTNFSADVDHHQRRNQPFWRNLVDGPTTAGKMRRRINVGAKMLGQADVARKVVVFLNRGYSPDLIRRSFRKLVSWYLSFTLCVRSITPRKPVAGAGLGYR